MRRLHNGGGNARQNYERYLARAREAPYPPIADVIADTGTVADCAQAKVSFLDMQYGPKARSQTSGDCESDLPKQ
jgi:hypothetical protein